MKGATYYRLMHDQPNPVSIHAPNEGSDPMGGTVLNVLLRFNPRSQ